MRLNTFVLKQISLSKAKRDTKKRSKTLSKLQAFETGKFYADGILIDADNNKRKLQQAGLKDLKDNNVEVVKIDKLQILI